MKSYEVFAGEFEMCIRSDNNETIRGSCLPGLASLLQEKSCHLPGRLLCLICTNVHFIQVGVAAFVDRLTSG